MNAVLTPSDNIFINFEHLNTTEHMLTPYTFNAMCINISSVVLKSKNNRKSQKGQTEWSEPPFTDIVSNTCYDVLIVWVGHG